MISKLWQWLWAVQWRECPSCRKRRWMKEHKYRWTKHEGMWYYNGPSHTCPRCKDTDRVKAPWFWRLFGWPWGKR